jgi:tetratricopeptide (TPR) repeat protein
MEPDAMRKTPWMTYLWPGLPQLWLDGSWSALALAITAAALLDVLLLSTLVWVEWFDRLAVHGGWLAAVGLWVGSAIMASRRRGAAVAVASDGSNEDLFRQAQGEYLLGDYFQAEATLVQLLGRNSRDAEGRLMLVTLLRRTKRYDEAEQQLNQLARLETAGYWQIEIAAERARLKRLRKQRPEVPKTEQLADATDEHLTTPIQLASTTQAA